jgi:hypothetical protein
MERATFLGGNAGIFALRSRTGVVKGRVFECGDDVRTTTVVRPDFEERARPKNHANYLLKRVELRGFEPLTPTLPEVGGVAEQAV